MALERVKKSSDTLMIFLLKACLPAKYRDQAVNKDNSTITYKPLSATEEFVRKLTAGELQPGKPLPESKAQ